MICHWNTQLVSCFEFSGSSHAERPGRDSNKHSLAVICMCTIHTINQNLDELTPLIWASPRLYNSLLRQNNQIIIATIRLNRQAGLGVVWVALGGRCLAWLDALLSDGRLETLNAPEATEQQAAPLHILAQHSAHQRELRLAAPAPLHQVTSVVTVIKSSMKFIHFNRKVCKSKSVSHFPMLICWTTIHWLNNSL